MTRRSRGLDGGAFAVTLSMVALMAMGSTASAAPEAEGATSGEEAGEEPESSPTASEAESSATASEGPREVLHVGLPGTSFYRNRSGGGVDSHRFVVSPDFEGWFPVADVAAVGFHWGYAVSGTYNDPGDDTTRHSPGNLEVTGWWIPDFFDSRLQLGGGFALPISAGRDDGTPLFRASAARGGWDQWVWNDDRFTIVLPSARIQRTFRETIEIRGEADLGIMVPVAHNDGDTRVNFQVRGEAAFLLGAFIPGARLQGVLGSGLCGGAAGGGGGGLGGVPGLGGGGCGDKTQLTFSPFLRFGAWDGYWEMRLNINADEPYGRAFDRDDGFFGFHMGYTKRF